MQPRPLLVVLAFVVNIMAIKAQPVKISFYNEKVTKSSSGAMQHEPDRAMTSFKQTGSGSAKVYFLIEIADAKAITAKYRLALQVFKKKGDAEQYAYSQEMGVPKQAGKVPFIGSNFMEGNYVARLVNKDNDTEVYAENTFAVEAMEKPDYKKNSTLVFCKTVDDNWNPVGATTKIKAGSCIQFLYKAKDKIFQSAMMWMIFRVGADGKEEYVNDLQQSGGNDPYRFLATDNVCEFSKPGKYRVYLFDKITYDTRHGVSEEYYGKAELLVE